MNEIRLISATVDPASTSEVSSRSSSLVPASTQAVTGRVLSTRVLDARSIKSDSGSQKANDVWTVSVGDDGVFNFYSAPQPSSSKSILDLVKGSQGSSAVWVPWKSPNMAAAMYAFYAALASPVSGRMLNVYA